jgi:hypothetical protein
MAISFWAPLIPTVSIIHAAFSTRRRAMSISHRASAMRSCQTDCSATGLPNATRALSRATIISKARSAAPIERMQ